MMDRSHLIVLLFIALLLFPATLTSKSINNTDTPETPGLSAPNRNALYIEILGSSINLYGLNYERTVRDNIHFRLGASRFTYVDEITYEETGEDISVKLHTIPVSVSYSFFSGIRKLELGAGVTLFHFEFWGGPYPVGYNDIEIGNRFLGLAVTSNISYRLVLENYLFRIGLHPLYMIPIQNEISGFFEELDDRGVLDFRDIVDPRGFMVIPGVSFGRRF